MDKAVAILGTNLPARGWALVFARAGYSVRLFNPEAATAAELSRQLRLTAGDLSENGLLGEEVSAVLGRITLVPSLVDALDGAHYVQDNTPTLEAKTAMFEELDRLAAPDAILASSQVGVLTSSFVEPLGCRNRVLIAHPINPALMPVVEVAPNPWTDEAVVDRTCVLLAEIGLRPLRLSEFKGLIIDRLAAALLHEAFRLVDAGLATVDQVDACVSDGLARRWVVAGPFETMDVNAPGGVVEYIAGSEPLMRSIFDEGQREAVTWNGPLAARVEAQRRRFLAAEQVGHRLEWRDQQLARLAVFKHRLSEQPHHTE